METQEKERDRDTTVYIRPIFQNIVVSIGAKRRSHILSVYISNLSESTFMGFPFSLGYWHILTILLLSIFSHWSWTLMGLCAPSKQTQLLHNQQLNSNIDTHREREQLLTAELSSIYCGRCIVLEISEWVNELNQIVKLPNLVNERVGYQAIVATKITTNMIKMLAKH